MVQIVNVPGFGQRLGESLGTGLGSGLGTGLQFLLSQQLQRQQRTQQSKGLESLGFSPEQAQSLIKLEPSLLKEVVKKQLAAPQEAQFAEALSSILGGPEQISQSEQVSGTVPGTQTKEVDDIAQRVRIPRGLSADQATKLAQLGLKKQQMTQRERQMAQSEQLEINKETRPYFDRVLKEKSAATKANQRLDRMERLARSGKLAGPGASSAADFVKNVFRLDVTHLLGPESEEFQKLSKDFLREAKDVFGSRLTDVDINQFLQTVPTLSQSMPGKLRVINNLKAFNKASKLKYETMKQIIKENNNTRPADLEIQVEERVSPLLDTIAEEFKTGYGQPGFDKLPPTSIFPLLDLAKLPRKLINLFR